MNLSNINPEKRAAILKNMQKPVPTDVQVSEEVDGGVVKAVVGGLVVRGGASLAAGFTAGAATFSMTREPISSTVVGATVTLLTARQNYLDVVHRGKKLNPLA